MLILASTADLVQLVTDAAVTVDVHASYVDWDGTTATPGRLNTAVSTAATTTVLPSPPTGVVRNLKTLHVRNKSTTSAVNVTVQHTDGTTTVQLHQDNLAAGEALEYVEGVGFSELAAPPGSALPSASAGTADQTANAADTYLAGSGLSVGGRLQAGSLFRWRLTMTKTAAGTAAPVFTVRCGAAGTTADTALCTFTLGAQTAAADTGWVEVEGIVRDAGASGLFECVLSLQHKNTTTGLAGTAQIQVVQALSAAFNFTQANLVLGVSCNPGTSGVWTFQSVSVQAANLKS